MTAGLVKNQSLQKNITLVKGYIVTKNRSIYCLKKDSNLYHFPPNGLPNLINGFKPLVLVKSNKAKQTTNYRKTQKKNLILPFNNEKQPLIFKNLIL